MKPAKYLDCPDLCKDLAAIQPSSFAMSSPRRTAAWVLDSQIGIEGLKFIEQLSLPPMKENDVLVKIHAASLNYRDQVIAKVERFS